jgi:hypothetical protein
MTQDHSAVTTTDLIEGTRASVWVLDHEQIQYRLADGTLRLGPDGLAGPVASLIEPFGPGSRDRSVAGPADTLALFCAGQFVARTPLTRPLVEGTELVHLGPDTDT